MTLARRLHVAAGVGLIMGLAEAAMLIARQSQGTWIHMGPHVAWMAPVADALLFAAVALVLALAPWRCSVFGLSLFAAWTIVLAVPRMASIAGVILAAGVAVQAMRWLERRPTWQAHVVRASGVWVAPGVVVLAAAVAGSEWNAERAAMARRPSPPPGAPNVLLVVLDTVRADALSLYGYGRPTSPHLAQLAAGGVVFDRAVATSSWTLPSHASMFTGRMPGELSTGWSTPLDATYPTLAEALAGRGYATAGVVGNLVYTGYESGLDRGFARYEDYRVTPLELLRSSGVARFVATHDWFRRATGFYQRLEATSAAGINASLLRWVDRTERPFFAFVNYFDAHSPYLPSAEFAGRFASSRAQRDPLKTDGWLFTTDVLTREEIEAERDAYDEAVAYLDAQLGALLAALQARGILDDTVVVVTADHGEQFGEHDLMLHGNSLYPELLHVPLVVAYPPRVPVGVRVAQPVSLRDIPASVMELAGAGPSPFPGQPLARWWTAPEAQRPAIPVAAELEQSHIAHRRGLLNSEGRLHAVIADTVQYIRGSNGREELYDLAADPGTRVNLAASEPGRRMLDRLRASMRDWRAAAE